MKRSLIVAAFAVVAFASTGGATLAGTGNLTGEELAICQMLELAHETTCAEYAELQTQIRQTAATAVPPASLATSSETTGSIGASDTPGGGGSGPFVPKTVPVKR